MRATRTALAALLLLAHAASAAAALPAARSRVATAAVRARSASFAPAPARPAAASQAALLSARAPSSRLPALAAPLRRAEVPLPAAAPLAARREARGAASAGSSPAAAAAPGRRPVLERLRAAFPGAPSRPDDAEGLGAAARRLFSFRLGAPEGRTAVLAAAARRTPGVVVTPPSGVEPDDGGGPEHPRRAIPFNGQTFPSVALRPNEPVESLLVKAIDASRDSIRIALYEFSSRRVLSALERARRRGVKVQLVLDFRAVFPEPAPEGQYQRRRSEQIWGLLRDGFDVRVVRTATAYGINHNKFAVFDGKLAEFGSYNWSYTSESSHYENVVFSDEADRVAGLGGYWEYLWNLGAPPAEAEARDWPSAVPAPPAAARTLAFNAARVPAWVFTPGDALEDALAAAIDAARDSVDYAMFSPRSTKVAEALARAKRRGLRVRAVIDRSQSESEYFKPFSDWLARQGVEVRTLSGPQRGESDFPLAEKMHHKFMVLDGRLVQTGSANHTKRASLDNYENAHFLDDPADAAAFVFAFEHMFRAAAPLENPGEAPLPTDESLRRDILDPPARPVPPPAQPEPPLPPARLVRFAGVEFPATAFRPYDPVEEKIVAAIDAARRTVKMAIYQFEQKPILEALRRAQARGVKVQVVLDRSHVYVTGVSHTGGPRKPRPLIVELVKSGFDLRLLKGEASGIQHNKFLVVDDGLLQAGSYNYTDQSEDDHFESVFFSVEKARVGLYRRYFRYLRTHSEEVNFGRLEEILNRRAPEEAFSTEQEEGLADGDVEEEPEAPDRDSKFPRPPQDFVRPVRLNGASFPRALFSPQGGIEEAVVRAIDAARVTLDLAMFSFYSRPIAEALKRALDRGVKVRVALDRSQTALSRIDDWLVWHGVEVRLVSGPDHRRDPLYQKMHNKFLVADGALALAGSYNYSPNAELNSFENVSFLDDRQDVSRFSAYFERVFLRGFKPFPPRREPSWKEDAPPPAS